MDNILILGAHSDIAIACADRFAEKGHSLILATREPSRLTNHRERLIKKFNIHVQIVDFEACNYEDHPSFWKKHETQADVVLVAIGHFDPKGESSHSQSYVLEALQSNYLGVVNILNIIASSFKAKKAGTIIGISSVAGERGRQSNMLYGSAKAGLTAYLSGLRNWLQPDGVHVATIKPGYVQTRMIAHLKTLKLLTATPEEVAEAIYRKAYKRHQNVVFIKPIWRLIMSIIRIIPEPFFKRLKL